MSNPNLVGKKLKADRIAKGMSQKAYAEYLTEVRNRGVTQSMVCDWETKPRISAYTDEWLRDLLGMKKKKGAASHG